MDNAQETISLIVALSVAVTALWRIHVRQDEKRDQLLDIANAGWQEQTAANSKIAEGLETIAEAITSLRKILKERG